MSSINAKINAARYFAIIFELTLNHCHKPHEHRSFHDCHTKDRIGSEIGKQVFIMVGGSCTTRLDKLTCLRPSSIYSLDFDRSASNQAFSMSSVAVGRLAGSITITSFKNVNRARSSSGEEICVSETTEVMIRRDCLFPGGVAVDRKNLRGRGRWTSVSLKQLWISKHQSSICQYLKSITLRTLTPSGQKS